MTLSNDERYGRWLMNYQELLQWHKDLYLNENDVVMSEYLRTCKTHIPIAMMRELLEWAGEDDLMQVLDNGEITEVSNNG